MAVKNMEILHVQLDCLARQASHAAATKGDTLAKMQSGVRYDEIGTLTNGSGDGIATNKCFNSSTTRTPR